MKRKPVYIKMPSDVNTDIYRKGLTRILDIKEPARIFVPRKFKIKTRHGGFIWKTEDEILDSGCEFIYNTDIAVGVGALIICGGLAFWILSLMQ